MSGTVTLPKPVEKPTNTRSGIGHLYRPSGSLVAICGARRTTPARSLWDGRVTPEVCVVCIELGLELGYFSRVQARRWWQFWRPQR